jgi:chromosome segregation ATPase
MAGEQFLSELREKTRELESLLDSYSERLRRMRQRNRELEEEISSFEADLDRLREWLAEHIDDETNP